MLVDPKPAGPSDVQSIDAQASTLMKRGLVLLGETRPDAIAEALACFDAALELRRSLPIDTVPAFRYGLAACWLNRADALMRLKDGAQISLARRAYDEAIALLRSLPLGDSPRFPRRLAIALQNRGLVLEAQGGPDIAEAIAAFTEAIAVLDHDDAALISDRRYLLAGVWMNLANARLAEQTAESSSLARDASRRALAIIAAVEADDVDAAEVGLHARHVLCRVLAQHLSRTAARGETTRDDVDEATDVVDEGLDRVRRWEQQGVARFRDLACDLFRFGARVYGRYQPQFLHEFILDNIDPAHSSPAYVDSPDMRAAAEEALALVNPPDGPVG